MGADRVAGQLLGDKEYPFSGVTKSGRVWRKLPESDARSLEEVAGKRCLEFGGRCRKAMPGVWVPGALPTVTRRPFNAGVNAVWNRRPAVSLVNESFTPSTFRR